MSIRALAFVAPFVLALSWAAPVVAQETQETLKATVVESKPAATAAAAAEGGALTTCSQGQNKRTVSIVSKEPGKAVPCEVHYKKETEQAGHDQVIYTATNELSFCEVKAKAFVEKLAGMGWSCN